MSQQQSKQPLIIALGHKARNGKDTVCSHLIETYKGKYDIKRVGFGDYVKKELNEMDQLEYCFRVGVKYDHDKPMTDPFCQTVHGKQSPLLQYHGEAMRKIDSLYWVKKLYTDLKQNTPQVCIIPDLRYRNEFMFVKGLGGGKPRMSWLIDVIREGFVDLTRDPNHISEVDLDGAPFDLEIRVKDGELEELKKDAITVFETILYNITPKIEDFPGLITAKAA